MITLRKMQDNIGIILLIGTLISASLVVLGGAIYLIQFGHLNLQAELLHTETYPLSVRQIWEIAFSFTPIGTIELGLLLLVITQIVRILMLVFFYAAIRDYWFTSISVFICAVLLYSFFWRV